MPLVWASKLFGRPLPERVAGSDLVPAILQAAAPLTKVFFLGASDESSEKAVENVRMRYPQVEVVGRLSPPFGFEHSEEWSDKIVTAIRESQAALVIVGFGAPKQELWVHRHQARLPGTVVLCVGATIDFLAGTVPRAPLWAQKVGVEWIHRLLSNPKRLAARYGRDAIHLPRLLLEDSRASRQG
jgi:N-acetylglucosaminyldiphosphoundecaprenol N-acetyl-beta-D-mannosaminyltransferase